MKRSIQLLIVLIATISLVTTGVIALQLGLFKGGKMTRTGVSITVEYSIDNITWSSNPDQGSTIVDPWYARCITTSSGYAGLINITWTMVDDASGVELVILSDYTDFTLSGAAGDVIYVTADGLGGPGYDWGPDASTPGTFYIQARVDK